MVKRDAAPGPAGGGFSGILCEGSCASPAHLLHHWDPSGLLNTQLELRDHALSLPQVLLCGACPGQGHQGCCSRSGHAARPRTAALNPRSPWNSRVATTLTLTATPSSLLSSKPHLSLYPAARAGSTGGSRGPAGASGQRELSLGHQDHEREAASLHEMLTAQPPAASSGMSCTRPRFSNTLQKSWFNTSESGFFV